MRAVLLALALAAAAWAEPPFYTLATLAATFEKMGYAVEKSPQNFLVTIERAGGTTRMLVACDEETVLLMYHLGNEVAKVDAIPARVVRKLLEENYRITPAHFAVFDDHVMLYRYLENRERTAVRWREHIEDLDAMMRRTADVWGAPEIEKASASPEGEPARAPASVGPGRSPGKIPGSPARERPTDSPRTSVEPASPAPTPAPSPSPR